MRHTSGKFEGKEGQNQKPAKILLKTALLYGIVSPIWSKLFRRSEISQNSFHFYRKYSVVWLNFDEYLLV